MKKHLIGSLIAICLIGGLRAESAVMDRVGVMGDSLSDMSMFSGTSFHNWIWQLGTVRGWSFGSNFAYDYAKSGATTLTVISGGQHTALAAVDPTLAVLLIGGNDLAFDLLMKDTIPSNLDAFADARVQAIRTAIETVAGTKDSPTGTKVVLFTTPEVLRVPIFLTFYSGFTSGTIRAYDQVATRMNTGIRALAAERNWPVIDLYQLMTDLMGSRTSPNTSFTLGGVSINLQSYSYNDPKPTDGFRKDGFHPNTVLQGLMANAVVLAVNAAYGETLSTMSDQTILSTAGVTDIPAGESYYDLSPYIWLKEPGDANCDGKVNVSDLSLLAANYGMTSGATWAMGDFTGDGAVNVSDLSLLAANYGFGVSTATDYASDYNAAFGVTTVSDASTDESESLDETTGSTACSSLGLLLLASLAMMGLMLVKLEE